MESHGFCTFPSRGSRGIDVLCVHRETRQVVAAEIGGASKVISTAFAKMREAAVPVGTLYVVAKRVTRRDGASSERTRWTFYGGSVDGRSTTLEAALSVALRDAT